MCVCVCLHAHLDTFIQIVLLNVFYCYITRTQNGCKFNVHLDADFCLTLNTRLRVATVVICLFNFLLFYCVGTWLKRNSLDNALSWIVFFNQKSWSIDENSVRYDS